MQKAMAKRVRALLVQGCAAMALLAFAPFATAQPPAQVKVPSFTPVSPRLSEAPDRAPPAVQSSAGAGTGDVWTTGSCAERVKASQGMTIPPGASLVEIQEATMFKYGNLMKIIDDGCMGRTPEEAALMKTSFVRTAHEQYYRHVEKECNAAQAGGRQCVARNHFGWGTTPVPGAPAPRLTARECETKKQQVIGTEVPPGASATASLETVMFMTGTAVAMIDGGCPGGTPEERVAERERYRQAYAAAEQNCNAVQSGGRRCVARVHSGGDTAAPGRDQVAATGPGSSRLVPCKGGGMTSDNPAAIDISSVTRADWGEFGFDPVTGMCNISERLLSRLSSGSAATDEQGSSPGNGDRRCGAICTAN